MVRNVLNLKFGDHVKTSKFKNVLAKVYVPNYSEEFFVTKRSAMDICRY